MILCSAQQLSKMYGAHPVFDNISLEIHEGDRIGLIGRNGSGKTTLFKLLAQTEPADEGEIHVQKGARVSYLSQSGLEGYDDDTVLKAFRDQVMVTEGNARHILARFLFYGPSVFRKVRDLSGGEQMRLRLAQLMYQDINMLILDEPTNHLDIDSREVLEEALQDFAGTILAVSHDRYFLNKLFGHIYWLENQQLTYYEGDYDRAREKRRERIEQHGH